MTWHANGSLIISVRDSDQQILAVVTQPRADARHVWDLADSQELIRGGVDEHPAAVEVETVFLEDSFLDLEAAAGFNGVHA